MNALPLKPYPTGDTFEVSSRSALETSARAQ
jgi:hypothetical protein